MTSFEEKLYIFYKGEIQKLEKFWKTIIENNGEYIIDFKILFFMKVSSISFGFELCTIFLTT